MAEPQPIPTRDLFLDHKNPRLTGSDFSVTDQDPILARLWSEFNVAEIVDSIVANNEFWQHEPLIAAKENGKLIVVEGNRRLAAVQLLLSRERQRKVGATGIPEISRELEEHLSVLPVIQSTRSNVWEFIGFKHVKGPQEWDSIAKAEYIARVHEEYNIPLIEIAKAIGDRNATVERLYHGLKVLHQAQTAGVFDPADRFYQRRDFAYSHLWTGLGYDGIRNFLGLKDGAKDNPKPVAKNKIQSLGELCLWMYGSHKENIEPLIKSQNPHLRQLDEALRSPRGIAALQRGLSLQVAVNSARGDTRLLLDALVAAEQNLRDAKAYFSTGFKGQQEIADTVTNINSLASSLQKELKGSDDK
ncbi:MAG TPA: hypothetical protein VHQ64_00765 [Pyrinomonadaceae bacterium]|nr:hypothetical protein [Pyrinomonadaceae bacterium]